MHISIAVFKPATILPLYMRMNGGSEKETGGRQRSSHILILLFVCHLGPPIGPDGTEIVAPAPGETFCATLWHFFF